LVVRRRPKVVSYFLVQKGKGGYSPILYREDKELFFWDIARGRRNKPVDAAPRSGEWMN
jgi:hypothetical protein